MLGGLCPRCLDCVEVDVEVVHEETVEADHVLVHKQTLGGNLLEVVVLEEAMEAHLD